MHKGAYVLADLGDKDPEIILMATGSEIQLIVKAGEKLAAEGKSVRLLSFPSWELFKVQNQTYRDKVLPKYIRTRLAVEAGVSQGWKRWVGDAGDVIAIDRYGASAPGNVVMEKLGFSVENVLARAKALLHDKK